MGGGEKSNRKGGGVQEKRKDNRRNMLKMRTEETQVRDSKKDEVGRRENARKRN